MNQYEQIMAVITSKVTLEVFPIIIYPANIEIINQIRMVGSARGIAKEKNVKIYNSIVTALTAKRSI